MCTKAFMLGRSLMSSSVEGDTGGTRQFVSLYLNRRSNPSYGTGDLHRGILPNTSFPVALHARVTGVLAGQLIEVRWRTTAPTATTRERTLVVRCD